MDNPIQNDAKEQELKHGESFGSTEPDKTNGGTSSSRKDPDTMLSMVVLLLACLGLAALAHVFV